MEYAIFGKVGHKIWSICLIATFFKGLIYGQDLHEEILGVSSLGPFNHMCKCGQFYWDPMWMIPWGLWRQILESCCDLNEYVETSWHYNVYKVFLDIVTKVSNMRYCKAQQIALDHRWKGRYQLDIPWLWQVALGGDGRDIVLNTREMALRIFARWCR